VFLPRRGLCVDDRQSGAGRNRKDDIALAKTTRKRISIHFPRKCHIGFEHTWYMRMKAPKLRMPQKFVVSEGSIPARSRCYYQDVPGPTRRNPANPARSGRKQR
jgi:hypothetical protein